MPKIYTSEQRKKCVECIIVVNQQKIAIKTTFCKTYYTLEKKLFEVRKGISSCV